MNCGEKCLFASAFVFLLTGFILYSPIDPEVHEPFKTRCMLALVKVLKFVGEIGEVFGYEKCLVMRTLLDTTVNIVQEPLSEGIQTREDTFDGVRVRIFEPLDDLEVVRPALIYLHGGWFSMGSPESHHGIADLLAYHLKAVIISVDYRLTPEYPFPAGFDDCYKVSQYVFKNVQKLRIDPKNIGIAGDSAGGALSAGVALKFRDHDQQYQFKYQVLIYPVTQGLSVNLPSYQFNEWQNAPLLQRYFIAEMFSIYVGGDKSLVPFILRGNHITEEMLHEYGNFINIKNLPPKFIPPHYNPEIYKIPEEYLASTEKDAGIDQKTKQTFINPYAFPLMAESLKKLPAAFIFTTEMDILRDDGILYAERLKKDGVNVTHYHDTGSFHGIFNFPKGPLSFTATKQAISHIVHFIQSL